jgi:hypothetical protein
MKKFLLLVILIYFFSFDGFSQSLYEMESLFIEIDARGTMRPINYRDKVEGTPLIFSNENTSLVIYTNDGKAYKIPKGNYNARTNNFVSTYIKDSIFSFNNNSIDYARLNNKRMKTYIGEDKKERFYTVFNEGENILLLKGYFAKIVLGTFNPMTKTRISNDKFTIQEKYFISYDKENSLSFSLKKKNILKIFDDKKNLMIDFIKENKLSYKNENDLLKMFHKYNSL